MLLAMRPRDRTPAVELNEKSVVPMDEVCVCKGDSGIGSEAIA